STGGTGVGGGGGRDAAPACAPPALRTTRRHPARSAGIAGQVADDLDRAVGGACGAGRQRDPGPRNAGRLSLQPGAERDGRHLADPEEHHRRPNPGADSAMSACAKSGGHRMYDMPPEIDVRADGDIRIITLNRPDALNAVNDPLHEGLAKLWDRLSEDYDARAAVLTGAGRAFSAGGDYAYLAGLGEAPRLRAKTLQHGREIVLGMTRCRVPVVAAVNGPAVGLGCSLV